MPGKHIESRKGGKKGMGKRGAKMTPERGSRKLKAQESPKTRLRNEKKTSKNSEDIRKSFRGQIRSQTAIRVRDHAKHWKRAKQGQSRDKKLVKRGGEKRQVLSKTDN